MAIDPRATMTVQEQMDDEYARMREYLTNLLTHLQRGRRMNGDYVRFTVDELETKIESLLTGKTIRGYNAYID